MRSELLVNLGAREPTLCDLVDRKVTPPTLKTFKM